MATITAGAVTPVQAPFNTSPAYSGSFIPTLWSGKLNVKFYAASTFASVSNTNWEGEISNLGDKVVINQIPSITINDYTIGGGVQYEVPAPSTLELQIDRAKYFAFQVNDVLELQSKPALMDMFSNDASEQMRVVMDSTCIYRTFSGGAKANKGATAGTKSGSYNLGTATAPVTLTASNILAKITAMSSVLDEQNVPESDRWMIITPAFRTLLLQSNLAQAQYMGDATSPVRNGMIGRIDRFTLYVSNQLPTIAANGTSWLSGDGSESSTSATTNANKRYAILAGHKSAITFASQMTKTEQLRNPTDFGDFVRGLQVFGHKVVKPEALALAVCY